MKLKGSFLFEGAAGGWFDGQHSLIGISAFAFFRSKGKNAFFEFKRDNRQWERRIYQTGDPLAVLQNVLNQFKAPPSVPSSPIPFLHGGAVGFISYDLIRQYEPVPSPREENPTLPDIEMAFVNCFIVLDHVQQKSDIVYDPAPLIEIGWDPRLAYEAGCHEMEAIERRIRRGEEVVSDSAFSVQRLESDLSEHEYIAMVERAKEYIAAGDIFQANLSHRFHADFEGESIFPLYRRLMEINPSPYSAYLNMGGVEIASGSPERLVRIKKGAGDFIETRPIAGTGPRGKTVEEDEKRITALYGSAKERAEHLMLVDLERNDIGKVADFGTVRVEAFMALEKYSHVFHLVSHIVGQMRPGTPAVEGLKALFPGGTITGVPKVRCMQIISELEKSARGLYTGSVGYIDFSGEIDFNIVIRTFVRQGNELSFQVGAGIVADSNPKMEYQETLHKAAALFQALESTASSSSKIR